MNTAMLVVSVISTIATIISCVIAVRAKNEVQRIVLSINSGNAREANVNNKGNFRLNNSGENYGVMGGVITGGVTNSVKKETEQRDR